MRLVRSLLFFSFVLCAPSYVYAIGCPQAYAPTYYLNEFLGLSVIAILASALVSIPKFFLYRGAIQDLTFRRLFLINALTTELCVLTYMGAAVSFDWWGPSLGLAISIVALLLPGLYFYFADRWLLNNAKNYDLSRRAHLRIIIASIVSILVGVASLVFYSVHPVHFFGGIRGIGFC